MSVDTERDVICPCCKGVLFRRVFGAGDATWFAMPASGVLNDFKGYYAMCPSCGKRVKLRFQAMPGDLKQRLSVAAAQDCD